MENCPTCGTKLIKTNYGRSWCPNCGIIEEEKESEERELSYIG
jgi:uncharacterized Zn finger protein (UPF0148 family)